MREAIVRSLDNSWGHHMLSGIDIAFGNSFCPTNIRLFQIYSRFTTCYKPSQPGLFRVTRMPTRTWCPDGSKPKQRTLVWRRVSTTTAKLELSGEDSNHPREEENKNRIPLEALEENVLYEGVVKKIFKYGFIVDIGAEKDAFVHISEISTGFVADVNKEVKLSQRIFVMLLRVKEGRIEASLKAAQKFLAKGNYDVQVSRLQEWGTVKKEPWKDLTAGIEEFYDDKDFKEVFLKTRRYT
eukprot:jgi/Galph1/827/GphlegSOOS_G5566.1